MKQYFIPDDVLVSTGFRLVGFQKRIICFGFFERNGRYSVQSGYRLAFELAYENSEGALAICNF